MALIKGRVISIGGGGIIIEDPSLEDGEMLRYDLATGKVVGCGDINSDILMDFGSKDIKTTGVVNSGAGTFRLGDGHDISSAGENVIFTNLVDNDHFNPVWVNQQTNEPSARLTVGSFLELTQESSKADVLINPTWISNPIVDWRVTHLTLEAETTITNAIFSIKRDGKEFYTAKLGTLTADVEKTIDLTTTVDNVPVDAFFGDIYSVTVSSADGDVRLKGSTANSLPFFKVGYYEFVDEGIALKNSVLELDNTNLYIPTSNYHPSTKKYVDDMVSSGITLQGEYDANTNTPNLETAPTGVLKGYLYIVTTAGTFFSKDVTIGDALISKIDDPQVEGDWVIMCRGLDATTVKILYESNPDTNEFSDSEEDKLANIEPLAEVNNISDANALDLIDGGDTTLHYHSSDRDRTNHSGTQVASTISDFDTEVDNNPTVVLNTAKNSYPSADATKLLGIEPLAEVNNISDVDATDLTDGGDSTLHYHSEDRDRANHTGTQLAVTISDFDTEIANNTAVATNTGKVSFPEAPADGKRYGRKDNGWDEILAGDLLSTNNLSDLGDIPTARTNLNVDVAGTDNSTDVTLSADDTTQETLDLAGQEIIVNLVTQTTDGAMFSEDKLKLDNVVENGGGNSWVSGLQITEHNPKNQTIDYSLGTYLIDGLLKTITPGANYALIPHYVGFTSYQHALVGIYVDGDETVKSIAGITAEKNEIADLPVIPTGSVCLAIVEIKVDSGANPKNIGNKEIEDCRLLGHYGSDEFVKISADDETTGHLMDKITNNGNITFTIENPGASETIKADYVPTGLKVYYAEDLTFTETTSSSYIEKMNLTNTFLAGTYLIDIMYDWDIDQDNTDFYSEVTLDGLILNEEHIQEIKEKGRVQRIPALRRFKQSLSGLQVIAINLKSGDGFAKARLTNASITVTKVDIQ